MATLNDLSFAHPLTPPAQAISEAIWHVAYQEAVNDGLGTLKAVYKADEAVRLAKLGALHDA